MQPRGLLRTKSYKVFLAPQTAHGTKVQSSPCLVSLHLMQFGRFAQKPDPPEYTTTGLHSGAEKDVWAPERKTRFKSTNTVSFIDPQKRDSASLRSPLERRLGIEHVEGCPSHVAPLDRGHERGTIDELVPGPRPAT